MSAALLLCPAPATAQSPSDQSPTSLTLLRDAARAFRTGESDRAADLAGAIVDRPEAVVLRARALRARGKYDEAVQLLTPAASADPGGDAALELGSLQLSLGRAADAEKLLTTVLARNVRVQDPPNLARAASAARWLGHFQQANDLFRDAVVLRDRRCGGADRVGRSAARQAQRGGRGALIPRRRCRSTARSRRHTSAWHASRSTPIRDGARHRRRASCGSIRTSWTRTCSRPNWRWTTRT